MLTYSRFVPFTAGAGYDYDDGMIDTVDHVRGHLSSCVDRDDDPENHMNDVTITYTAEDDGCLVTGSIDREPNAPYLREGYDPDRDDEQHEFTRYSEDGRE